MTAASPAPHRTARGQALLAAHVAAVLFGLSSILGALIQADAALITGGRAAFAALALAIFAARLKRPLLRDLDGRRLRILLLGGSVLAAHWVSFFLAVKTGGVAVAALGFASFPAFIALIDALVFGERIGRAEQATLALVSAGLVLVTPSFDIGDRGTVGLLWGLLSGFTFAVLAIVNRRGSRGIDGFQVAFWQNLVVAMLVLPLAWQGLAVLAPLDWGWLLLLGTLCTGLAHYLFVRSLDGLDARHVGVIVALEPVYAIACAWWLFGEQPSLRMLAGAALIILATLLASRAQKGQETS